MRRDVITKFREFWRGLTPDQKEEAWDLLTALRSEDFLSSAWDDNSHFEVKARTTSRIRYALLGRYLCKSLAPMCDYSAKAQPYNTNSPKDIAEKIKSSHFSRHFCYAVRVLHKRLPKNEREKISDLVDIVKKICPKDLD